MVNILFQLVDGSNVIGHFQTKLYGFHRQSSVDRLRDENDDNYLSISSIYLLAVSPVIMRI